MINGPAHSNPLKEKKHIWYPSRNDLTRFILISVAVSVFFYGSPILALAGISTSLNIISFIAHRIFHKSVEKNGDASGRNLNSKTQTEAYRLKGEPKKTNKILIIPLSLLVGTRPLDSLVAFNRLGISYLSITWNWRATNKIIENYKSGLLDDTAFLSGLKNLYPKLKSVDDNKTWDAWNKMCSINEENKNTLRFMERLEEQGITVCIFSRTNPSHVRKIEKELGTKIPGMKVYSFDQDPKDNDLLKKLMNTLHEDNPNLKKEDIQYCVKEPTNLPYPSLTWFPALRWVFSPFRMWFYQGAVNQVNHVKAQANKLGYTSLTINDTTASDFKEPLCKLKWISSEDKIDPTVKIALEKSGKSFSLRIPKPIPSSTTGAAPQVESKQKVRLV